MPFRVAGNAEVQDRLSIFKDVSGDGIYQEVMWFEDNVIGSGTNTNGDIQIAPDGTGDVYIGKISGNSQISSGTNIVLSLETINLPTADADLNITSTGNGVVSINNVAVSSGLIAPNTNNTSLEIRASGTGFLRLGSNLDLKQDDNSTFNSLPSSYSAVSMATNNIGSGNARHLLLRAAGSEGRVILDQLGFRSNVLQNVNDSYNVVIRRINASTNVSSELTLSQNDFSLLSNAGTPTFNLKTSSGNVLTVSNTAGVSKFDSSSFLLVNGSNNYLNISSTGVGVMKNNAATEALDVSGNIFSSGNISAAGNVVAGTGLTVSAGGLSVSAGGLTVSSGNVSVSNGNLTVSGTISDQNGVLGASQWSDNGTSIYYNDGNVGIGLNNPSKKLDIVGDINFTGTLYKNGSVFTGDSQWSINGTNIEYTSGKVTIGSDGAVEFENNVISSSEKNNSLLGRSLTASNPIKEGYASADGSSKSVYDYYHASKVMDSYNLVPSLTSNTSSSAGSVVGNGTHGLIAEYYKGYAWNTLMKRVHDTQINYGNNAQFMSKVREYSGSFNRMFSVKWEGNLSLEAGAYDLIIDDAVFAPGQHTITDLFESGPYSEVNQPIVDNETSWLDVAWFALMNGMRIPYLSEILERRELGVDLKAIVSMIDDTSISNIDTYNELSNANQWQYSGSHYVSINTGGEGDVTDSFGYIYSSHPGGDFDEFSLLMRSDCRLFDTQYIDNDYNQPNNDANTNKGSWASKNRFAQAVGGRLPTIEEVRARKFLQINHTGVTNDIWIPCTNSKYADHASEPGSDYVQIGHLSVHWFGRSLRDSGSGSLGGWATSDNFDYYERLTLVMFDNMDQSLSYNGFSVTGTNIVSKTAVVYTKKYSINVIDQEPYSIQFSKNGQGYRQLLLAPQNGSKKRWLTPLDFTVSHSSVVERYKAFDGSLIDEFTSLNYIREPIGWVGSSKTVLDSVVLGAKSGSEMFMPRLFDVEGTVDGVHWKRLKSFGAVKWYGQKEFIVGSGLGCIGYRIVVIGTFMSGVDDVVKLASLQFKTRGYESFAVPSDSGKMINLTNTDEDVYITSNSGVINVGDVAFKENSLFVRKLQSETDIGRLIDWNGTSAIPEGYVVADGSEYSGDDYPEAYKKSLEDTAVVHDIVPALKSNSSSSEGVVVTGSETVQNGLIAHCYDTGSNGSSYVYVKSELVDNIDMDDTAFNALFNSSNQDTAIINFEGYLYINSSADYTFYINVDGYGVIMIDDEQLGWHTGTVNTWVDFSTYVGSSSQATKYLSQGYHKIRVNKYEGSSTAGIHIAMATGGTPVSNISDSDIIPSSSFVPYLKEDYYKAFDKKDLLTISPDKLDDGSIRLYTPGMEKNSMAIRSSLVAFYEYIGWYASQEYVITYFTLAPYNLTGYYSYAVDFELQGSNDNSNWTTIQSYAGATSSIINYVSPYGNGYRGYRVKVLSNNSNASSSVAQKMIVCNELGFYGVRLEDYHKHIPRNLVPVMTSNNTPRGIAIAGTTHSSSYDNWMAFDNNNGTIYHTSTSIFTGAALNEEQYLGWYDTSLVRKKIITGFSMYARYIGLPERSPVYFKLQGTLDGFTWYDIETFSKTYMKLDSYAEHFVVSKEKYVECIGFRLLLIAPNVGTSADYFDINFMQVWAFDHGVFNVPKASGKLFKLYEGTSVLKLGKNTDAPYVTYDTSSLGTQKTLADPVPAGFVSIDTTGGSTTLDVEDYPELIDKHIYVGKEYSLVPALTSNTSEGVVVYSNFNSVTTYTSPHLAFDGIQGYGSSDYDKGYNSYPNMDGTQTSTIGWYNTEMSSKKILKAILVYGRISSSGLESWRAPSKFNVQGTLDGTNWITIQSWDITSEGGYNSKYFRIDASNTTVSHAYFGFRLEVFETCGYSGIGTSGGNLGASPTILHTLILSQLKFIVEDYNEDVLVQLFPSSLVPIMTSATAPSGNVVASGYYGTSYPWVAFNPDTLSEWHPENTPSDDTSNHSPNYIGWYNTSLSSKKIITSIFLHSVFPDISNNWLRFVISFKLEGTLDGTNWHFIENISFNMAQHYYIASISNRTTAYYGFRIVIVVPTTSYIYHPPSNEPSIISVLDFQCVDESDLKTLTLSDTAGKMLKVSNAIEVGERLNDNLVEVGSLALDTLRGNNELAVGATRKWNGVGYVPRGFAVMRGQRLGTLDYPKVFEALVDLQTPFLINPAMTTETLPSGVVVYSSEYSSSSGYKPEAAFNRGIVDDLVSWLSQHPAVYPEHIGWYDTTFDKKKILMEFYLWARFYDLGTDYYGQHMPGIFSVQGTLDGSSWTTIQTYDMMFTGNNGYDKGVFIVDEVNRHTAYYGFRLLIFNRVGNQGDWIGLQEISFYVIDEPSKPVVLQPKPLVPNYTDWDNPSGNLVFSSYLTDYYPWRAFNNEYINYTSSGTDFGWASGDAPIDRLNALPYTGEYIGWYNTQLLKKKVLIYSRWNISIAHPNRYNYESALEGFIQGTIDGVNWENIQGFNTGGQYIEYYLNNDNRNKAYYGFRLYITKTQGNTSAYSVVVDSLQFMCLDEDEYFSFELPDSPDTLVNLERVQGIAVEGSIGTNSRGDGLSIKVDNNSETNSALVVSNNIGNEIEEASTTLLNVRNNGGIDIGGYLRIGMSSIDAGQHYQGRFSLFIATTYSNTDPYKYGWWIGGQDHAATSGDNDLHFSVVRDGVLSHPAMIQDSINSNVQMNFTGQHRTFVNDISLSSIDEYTGLIVCASQDAYVKMSGGIAYGQDAITMNESLPVVALSKNLKDKRCFGVISSMEDPEQRKEANGNFVSLFTKEKGDTRVYINSVGEGAMWVVSGRHGVGGSLESGDYITTSNITGYGCLQDDDLLHNYTVAKITMNCNFVPPKVPKMVIKKDEKGENVLDDDGLLQWTQMLDSEGAVVYEDKYLVRYILADGTELTYDEYIECIENDADVYIAAFVGCTYHCG